MAGGRRRRKGRRDDGAPATRELDLGGEHPSARAQVRGHLVEMKASRSEVSWRYLSWGGQSSPAALVAWPLAFVAALALVLAGALGVALVLNDSTAWTPVYVLLGIGVAALAGAGGLAVHRRRPDPAGDPAGLPAVDATVVEVAGPVVDAPVVQAPARPADAGHAPTGAATGTATPTAVAPDAGRALPPAGTGAAAADERTGPVRDTPLP